MHSNRMVSNVTLKCRLRFFSQQFPSNDLISARVKTAFDTNPRFLRICSVRNTYALVEFVLNVTPAPPTTFPPRTAVESFIFY